MYGWWGRGPWGRRHSEAFHRGPGGHGGHGGHGGFKRPLRFLIEHLGLDDAQASEVSRALDDLRLDREQSALDQRRARSRLADLLHEDTLNQAELDQLADVRLAAAKRERDALVRAVTRVHAALKPEQRRQLATLLRSGPFAF